MGVRIFKAVSTVVMTALSIVSMVFFGFFAGDFKPLDTDKVLLNFATISDVHITDSRLRTFMLELGLDDIEKASYPVDALVISGDITDHGYREQWENVYGAFSKYDISNVILAEGNHDTWTEDEKYDEAEKLFIEYNKKISNRDIENAYYSTKINGYTFIMLASERDITAAYFSDEQLAWLGETMEKASMDGLPIFVVSHQPINGSHGLPQTWEDDSTDPQDGGMGEQSDAVEEILKQYDNVFLISGHIHNGIGEKVTSKKLNYKSVESDGSFHSINLPSYMYFNIRGQLSSGTGFQFEVYNDSVVIRGRSYSSDVWYTCYEYSIPLV